MHEKKEEEKKELELTPQLMYRLYPERLKGDESAESDTEVKTLTEKELKSEEIIKKEVEYYDSESSSYKSTGFNNR
jgi:hypothetical protein